MNATTLLAVLLGAPPAAAPDWAAADHDYAAFRGRVAAGSPGTLYVGVKARPTYDDCWLPSGALGLADGAYDCTFEGGRAVFRPRAATAAPTTATAAPAVPRPTFRGGRDPDHTCDACGRYVNRIAGWNRDGTHRHDCPCGNSWYH